MLGLLLMKKNLFLKYDGFNQNYFIRFEFMTSRNKKKMEDEVQEC